MTIVNYINPMNCLLGDLDQNIQNAIFYHQQVMKLSDLYSKFSFDLQKLSKQTSEKAPFTTCAVSALQLSDFIQKLSQHSHSISTSLDCQSSAIFISNQKKSLRFHLQQFEQISKPLLKMRQEKDSLKEKITKLQLDLQSTAKAERIQKNLQESRNLLQEIENSYFVQKTLLQRTVQQKEEEMKILLNSILETYSKKNSQIEAVFQPVGIKFLQNQEMRALPVLNQVELEDVLQQMDHEIELI